MMIVVHNEALVEHVIDRLGRGETAKQVFENIKIADYESTVLAVIDRLHEMCSLNLIADLESGEFQVHGRLPAPLEEEIQDAISRAVRRARKKLLDGLIAADAVKSKKVKR